MLATAALVFPITQPAVQRARTPTGPKPLADYPGLGAQARAQVINPSPHQFEFRYLDGRGAVLPYIMPGSTYTACDFRGADLHAIDFRNCTLAGCDFRGADLSDADLSDARLWGCDLYGARLARTRLTRAVYDDWTDWPRGVSPSSRSATRGSADGLFRCTLGAGRKGMVGVNLAGGDLRGAAWPRWVFRRVTLRRANLKGANLEGGTFEGADLRGANLAGANLKRTCFWHADLREADLRTSSLDLAVYDLDTRWPAGFDPQRAGARLVE